MLNIIKSGFTSGGHEKIKKDIKRLVGLGKKVILIVPEQQTLLAEAEMVDILPPSSPLIFEVTNFTRLANTTARALGGISGEYCDKTKRSLLMWRTLTELSPVLFGISGNINEGLVNRYLNASLSLDALGISADMLSEAGESEFVKDSRLKTKLCDLASVHSLYKKLISERYGDSENECVRMLEKLRTHPEYLSDTVIFIEGFISFTETQYALIREFASRSTLTVLIYISHHSSDSFEYTEVNLALERLKKEGRLSGKEVKIFNEDSRREDDVISLVVDGLWRKSGVYGKLSLQNSDKIRIIEAETPFEECEFVASDIKRRVMSGASFSDFAVVARHTEKYNGILDTAFDLAKIPAFISKPSDITSYEVIKLIFSSYAVPRSGYARENVISYAKCTLGGVSRDLCDELEYYVEKWQISGRGFSDGEDWSMNPDGYSIAWKQGAVERLARINQTRENILRPLIEFAEAAKEAKTVREQAEALYDHLVSIGVPEGLDKRAALLISLGEASRAEECGRIWDTVCKALDTLVEVNGDLPSDPDSFVSQLKICFGNTEMSKIPAYADQVTVGSADMIRLYGKKHIYLIGVNAGEFPSAVSDNSYFTESDKTVLSRAGLLLVPDLDVRGARELYLFARAFTYAEESVTLSYTVRDTKFKSRGRDRIIDRIIELFDWEIKEIKFSSLGAKERLWSAKPSLVTLSSLSPDEVSAAESALVLAGEGELVDISHESITNDNLDFNGKLTLKRADSPISLTQSRIDSYNNCPLGYFCRYTLALSPEERAEFDVRNIGTFIHAILENVFRSLSEKSTETAELTKEERAQITERAAEKYLCDLGEGSITSERIKIKISRLVRAAMPIVDGLCEEFAVSKFKPKFFELAITREKEDSPEPVKTKTSDGRDVFVYGYIDRVDTYEKDENVYIRVVDYKTGAKSFSPDDPKNGKNLQMFLYLKSILDDKKESFKNMIGVKGDGKVVPAGVIYVKTSISDTKVDIPDDTLAEKAVSDAQKREGMVLNDENVIEAMGLRYTPLYSSRMPDKIPDSKREFLFTEESLNEILDQSLAAVCQVADGMIGGNIKAVPRIHEGGKTYCDSCEFKPICRKAVI